MKKIDTVVEDIYKVLSSGEAVTDEEVNELGLAIASKLKDSLDPARRLQTEETLRMSNIGKPSRQLWYQLKAKPKTKKYEDLHPSRILAFIYGDIIEELLIFLVKKAGHTVTERQGEVEREGIKGHKDCRIDGIGVDTKSASGWSFNKFLDKELFAMSDVFGYLYQLDGYFHNEPEAAFLAMNKENGELALTKYNSLELPNSVERIKEIKEFLKNPLPPEEKCYPDVPSGKKNKELNKYCTYCPFKVECWKDCNKGVGLRAFKYSNGIKYLTEVKEKPRVPEIEIEK